MKKCLIALLFILFLSATPAMAGDCGGNRCCKAPLRKAARATFRVATAPMRIVRCSTILTARATKRTACATAKATKKVVNKAAKAVCESCVPGATCEACKK